MDERFSRGLLGALSGVALDEAVALLQKLFRWPEDAVPIGWLIDETALDDADRTGLDDGETPVAWLDLWQRLVDEVAPEDARLVRLQSGRMGLRIRATSLELTASALREALTDGSAEFTGSWAVCWGLDEAARPGVPVRCSGILAPVVDGMGILWVRQG